MLTGCRSVMSPQRRNLLKTGNSRSFLTYAPARENSFPRKNFHPQRYQAALCQKRTNTVWCSFTLGQKILKITDEKSNYSESISDNW
mgnify:CR=1 FL=1